MHPSLAIKASGLSKKYRLGTIGMTSLREDLSRWWNKRNGSKQSVDFSKKLEIEETRMINEFDFWALNDLDFTIPRGEVVGIIGANGSGKSTLLKILSRITEPTKGEVKVRGKVASLLEVGTGFHPELTGRENVYVNGAILGMTRKEVNRKFDEIVDFSGVGDFIETPIKRYSSGMTVRLGFAVAAHLDPDILIVDEVLAVGDASFQKKCMGKMKDIAGGGNTILLVSHQLPMIENLCDSAFLLENGKIDASGQTKEIVNHYLSKSPSILRGNNDQNYSDRKGTGEITLTKVSLTSSNLAKSNSIKLGDSATIDFFFKSKKHNEVKREISFRFGISNSIGKRISTVDSRSINFKIKAESTFRIRTLLKRISFPVGIYYITTFLGEQESPIDWIENAFEFNIVDGDFYGTGRSQKVGEGEVLLDYKMTDNLHDSYR
mgnify:FL=1